MQFWQLTWWLTWPWRFPSGSSVMLRAQPEDSQASGALCCVVLCRVVSLTHDMTPESLQDFLITAACTEHLVQLHHQPPVALFGVLVVTPSVDMGTLVSAPVCSLFLSAPLCCVSFCECWFNKSNSFSFCTTHIFLNPHWSFGMVSYTKYTC